jgi:hypothetical protein
MASAPIARQRPSNNATTADRVAVTRFNVDFGGAYWARRRSDGASADTRPSIRAARVYERRVEGCGGRWLVDRRLSPGVQSVTRCS